MEPAGPPPTAPLLGKRASTVSRSIHPLIARLSIETSQEASDVFWLALQAFLANSVFVIGRNLGPVIFMHACGPDELTFALFLSGASIIFVSPLYGYLSKNVPAARVNLVLTLFCTFFLLLLAAPLLLTQRSAAAEIEPSVVAAAKRVRWFAAYMMFLAQDVLTLLLMMQSSSLAQATLDAYSAKRLLGLVQLGCSSGAIVTGLAVGPLAQALGPDMLILLQGALLLLSLLPNSFIARAEERSLAIGGQRTRRKQRGAVTHEGGGWYKNGLILAMALWIFSIIFCKTIVEFQYNVLVAAELSQVQMVGLTGYLYASAGVLSSVLNAFGTQHLLRYLGLGLVLVMSPAAELFAAMGIAIYPGVASAFVGRMLDLTMRWSLNNSAKSLLWIATPRAEQEMAKPWIEGFVKKATGSLTAVAIATTLAITGGSSEALALLSAVIAAAACGACFRMHRLYSASMWAQISKREMPLTEIETWAEWGTEGLGGGGGDGGHVGSSAGFAQLNDNVSASIAQRLIYGPPHVQLYVLRQLGEALPPSTWRELLDAWDNLSAAVQIRILRLCAKDEITFPNDWLLSLLTEERFQEQQERGESVVLAHIILACAERRLTAARPTLTRFMESPIGRVRAAAATTLIRLGWGIGFGAITQIAQALLEQMLEVPLGDEGAGSTAFGQTYSRPLSAVGLVRTPSVVGGVPASPRLMQHLPKSPRGPTPRASTFRDNGAADAAADDALNARVDELTAMASRLQAEWDCFVQAGEEGRAMAKALQLTRVKGSLAAAERAARTSSKPPSPTRVGLSVSTGNDDPTPARGLLAVDDESLGVAEPSKRAYTRAAVVSSLPASVRDTIHAIEMIRKLPEEITTAILPGSSLLLLLSHPSRHVLDAALPLVRRSLQSESLEVQDGLVRAAVQCLQLPETRHHATKALRHLVTSDDNDEEIAALAVRLARSDLIATLSRAAEPEQQPKGAVESVGAGASTTSSGLQLSAAVSGLLDFLHDASLATEQPATTEAHAADLLAAASRVRSDECAQELLDALLRFKAAGRGCPTRLLEASVRQEALELLKGLSILRWLSSLHAMSIPPPPSPMWARLLEDVEMQDAWHTSKETPSARDVSQALAVLKELGSQHLEERLYLKRLRLVKLAMLCAKTVASVSKHEPANGASTKTPSLGAVLAAWKLLRSDNPKAQAAALEVVEMVLGSGPLASVVMPLIDSSPMEKQLRIGDATFPELHLADPHAAPPWIRSWLAADGDRLGCALGDLCADLAGGVAYASLRPNLARKATLPFSSSLGSLPSIAAVATPVVEQGVRDAHTSTSGVIARTVLLRGVPLFRNLLTLHVSNLALRTHLRHVVSGEHFARPGEAYLLVSGNVHKAGRPERVYRRGQALQQLGCIYDTLPPIDLVAGSSDPKARSADAPRFAADEARAPGGACLLVITHVAVWDVLTSSSPRFGLSLLRAMVRLGQPNKSPADTATPAGALDPVAFAVEANAEPVDAAEPTAAAKVALQESERLREAEADAHAVRTASWHGGAGAKKPSDEVDARGASVIELDAQQDGDEDGEEEGIDLGSTGTSLHTNDETDVSSNGEGRTTANARGRVQSFSYLERALLLREVHLLRFVDTEFLPSLAAITTEELVARGELVCDQGEPTNASLIVVAHGRLKAWRRSEAKGPAETIGEVHAGESLGNTTALLPDSLWQYSATALEDTWTLTIRSRELTDLLRGREEFAHAMLRGFFDTFSRRLRQVVEQGGSVKREWMLAADVNKSPMVRPSKGHAGGGASKLSVFVL